MSWMIPLPGPPGERCVANPSAQRFEKCKTLTNKRNRKRTAEEPPDPPTRFCICHISTSMFSLFCLLLSVLHTILVHILDCPILQCSYPWTEYRDDGDDRHTSTSSIRLIDWRSAHASTTCSCTSGSYAMTSRRSEMPESEAMAHSSSLNLEQAHHLLKSCHSLS